MRQTANRSEAFGRLLSGAINSIAAYEGKTAQIVEEGLGAQIGVAGKTIQRYKAGCLPPDDRKVKILAEAAIQRGFLAREWLQRFLHAARYPSVETEKLLDQLCPVDASRPRPPRVCQNLPAPTYSQFVPRPQAYAEVIDGLWRRLAVVLIVGLGGTGKTSLAREVATHCLQDNGDAPTFDAVVWMSDKDRPGTTNLSVVLDEIARTLDYPGFTQYEHEEKRRGVEQLLRGQRVLLIIDNFETITDGALLDWLLRLPEPSKALVTSREKQQALWSSWLVELHGMSEDEAQAFISERVRRLGIEKLVSDRSHFLPLIAATGGNPKAIEMAVGCFKYEHRPLQQVVNDLYAARGKLFDDLFMRAWGQLSEAARQVLLAMTFFPANVSGEALSVTANVQGFAFDQAMERLTDLALLDVQQADLTSVPRYTLHPLVRAFAGNKLAESPSLELAARKRWMGWYVHLVSEIGYCWNDLSRLKPLDHEHETVYTVLNWAFQNQHYAEALQVARGFEYYYFVRGVWNRKLIVDEIRAKAAHNLNEPMEELTALASRIHVLSLQNNPTEAEKDLPRLNELAQSTELSGDYYHLYRNALAAFWKTRNDVDKAQQILEQCFERSGQFSPPREVNNLAWLADCFYRKNMHDKAQELFHKALQLARQHRFERAIPFLQLRLVDINIDQGNLEEVDEALVKSSVSAHQYQERQCIARIQRCYARLHTHRKDLRSAQKALTAAIDCFERLGMHREHAEAREELARLEKREEGLELST